MAHIPECVNYKEMDERFEATGLERISAGKVRHSYQCEDGDEIFSVATDRLSIFDFVLPTTVPKKGEVLTALTIFWLEEVLKGIPNHLETYGAGLIIKDFNGDDYANRLNGELADDKDILRRTLIIKALDIEPIECIIRGYLTGSGWRDYQKSGKVCGHVLPEGLHDGSRLSWPLFTPSTKADEGHDENIDAQGVLDFYSWQLEGLSQMIFARASAYCAAHGIILADTKFELGRDEDGELMLADEVLTPDSSRFWDELEWRIAAEKGKSPSGYDKEPVRQWGMTVETPFGVTGLNKLETENAEHLAFVDGLVVPAEVVANTTARYLEIFQRLTGMSLEQFQKEKMGIE